MPRVIQRYRDALPKLFALSPREWKDMCVAQFRLLVAQFQVATRPTGQLVSVNPVEGAPAPVSPRLNDARALALAIGRAAEFGMFRPACLVRSIALARMLESRGITGARVQVGVIVREERLAAHAWVEYAGEILGDDPHSVSHFDPLPGLRLRDSAPNGSA